MAEDDNMEAMESQWRQIEEHYKNGKPVVAQIIEASEPRIIVDVGGIRGVVEEPVAFVFYPLSDGQQPSKEERLKRFYEKKKGEHLQLKVIAVDRERNHLLLTQQLYTKEEQEARRLREKQLLQELRPGDVRRGIVAALRSIMVTIDIEGVEAHLFRRRSGIKDAGEDLQIGQEIEVMVLATDGRSVQVSQAHAQNRDEVLRELRPGQTRTAPICCLSSEGVYVDLGGPIGFIPTAQAVHGYITHPADRFARGQQLDVKIEQIDDKKNVLLSLVDH